MDVAVAEEPQKKVFRARKTMKISDRQQLEFLHNSLPSCTIPSPSAPSPSPPSALVNGKHSEDEQPDGDEEGQSPANEGEREMRPGTPASRSPSPLALALSLSPSPSSQTTEPRACTPPLSAPQCSSDDMDKAQEEALSPSVEVGERKDEEDEKGEETVTKEGCSQKVDPSSPQEPSLDITAPPSTSEGEQDTEKGEKEAMDTDLAPMATDEIATPALNAASPSCQSLSSPQAPESDLEVKEGFLVLSEEDENQAEKDEEKKENATIERKDEEKMEVDLDNGGEEGQDIGKGNEEGQDIGKGNEEGQKATIVGEEKEAGIDSSAVPPTSGEEECSPATPRRKRSLSQEGDADGKREEEKEGKRQKVEGDELEAQLELKIRSGTGSRLQLEKVVQQLVEERLRVLQLSVFDRSLQELRERVEKMDCATKHQQTLNTLQAKIARLAKKFGAANQTKDNVKKPTEASSLPSSAATTPATSTNTTATSRRVLRTAVESKQSAQNQTSSGGLTAQHKSLSTPTSASLCTVAPSPVLSLMATAGSSNAAPSSATVERSQPGTLLLKTTPTNSVVAQSTPTSAQQPVSLQPLLIQLPLAVTSSQGGAIMTNHNTGVELFPVTSLAAVSTLNKSKTTTPTTTFILQKSTPLSSAPPVTPSQSLPQITLTRAVYPGGSGIISVPSSGVSVSSARTPTQCVSVVGVTSSSSSPSSSAPAATGGQSAGSTATAPTSVTAMASKTDNQTTICTAVKTPVKVSRTSSSRAVIDLTEDDDDVQVTGVQKAPLHSGLAVAASASTTSLSSQRPVGAPPPLISSTNTPALASGTTLRSSPQVGLVNGPQLTVHHRPPQDSPSKTRGANLGSTTAASPISNQNGQTSQLPPLPSPPPPQSRLPPEAAHTSSPQQPQLKLARVQSQNGIVLSWCVAETDRTCAAVDSYHLYAYHQDHSGPTGASLPQSQWKKIGEVKALPLPMACTLTQFVSGSTYYFAVRARDVYGRFGPFCEPQCTDVISSTSSS